jgi:MFS transporter, DHA1 family, tetracycline resistance protein
VTTPLSRLRRTSPLAIIFASVFVDMLGYGMIVPLLPFLIREQTPSALVVGLFSSLYALMQLFVAPLLGALSDRIGRRPVLIGCLFGSGLAYVLLSVSTSLGMLALAVALGGAAGASNATAQAFITDVTPREQRARGLGLIGAAFGLGLMVGPALAALLSPYGLGVPALAAGGFALLNTFYALLVLPESLPPERRTRHAVQIGGFIRRLASALVLPAVRPLLLAIFLLNLAFNGLQSNFPLFSSVRFGWDVQANGLFYAYVGVCAVFTQGVLVGWVQPRFGEMRLVLAGLGAMALALVLMAAAPAAWMLFPLVGMIALGSGLAIPALTSLVSQRTPEGQLGAVLGGTQAVLSLTLIFGPAIAGVLFDLIGAGAPYLAGGLLAGVALVAVALCAQTGQSSSTADPSA